MNTLSIRVTANEITNVIKAVAIANTTIGKDVFDIEKMSKSEDFGVYSNNEKFNSIFWGAVQGLGLTAKQIAA